MCALIHEVKRAPDTGGGYATHKQGSVAVSDVALFDVSLCHFHQWWSAISAKICGTVSQRRSRLLNRH